MNSAVVLTPGTAPVRGASRDYPGRPFLAVSIAVFRAGQVLLAKRAYSPYKGAFSLPGGLVETGETLEEAALRELREEVAVEARIIAFNQHVQAIERDRAGQIRHHYVVASFAGLWVSGEARPGPEATEILWIEPKQLAALNGTPHLVPVVRAAERLLKDA